VAQAERTRESVAVHILKIDTSAEMREATQEVARRIAALVRKSDAWTELDDGRFAILQRSVSKAEGALLLARMLLANATAPVGQGERKVRLGATVGLCFHASGAGPMELLARAEFARQQALHDGRRVRCWQSAAFDASSSFIRQERLLKAMEKQELFLEYQPQIELASGRLSGFEALVRWHHPRLGIIGPDAFVPLAEQSGLIFELGGWVLQDACQRCRDWNAKDLPETSVAVNVSPIQLLSEGFPAQVESTLEKSGLEPNLLELELTESSSVHGSEEAAATLRDLKALGIRLALDDFGTGYNSLCYLQQLPVDKIKTPKEFVQDTAAGAPLIEAITIIGRRFGLEVVAEGVETEVQLRTVRDAGCHFAQGFLWGQPAAEVSLLARAAEQHARPLPWNGASSLAASPALRP